MDIEHQNPTQYKTTESSVAYGHFVFNQLFSSADTDTFQKPIIPYFQPLAGCLIKTMQPIEKNNLSKKQYKLIDYD